MAAPERVLDGRHAIVTGGGTGIGAAVAEALAREGARITLVGRRAGPLAAGRAALEQRGAEAQDVVADVTDAEWVARAIAAAARRFGPAAILVNNAGAAESAPFLETDAALLDRMLAVNLRGAFHCTKAALPAMIEAGWGRVVNLASTAGITGYPYVAAYCAAKHALLGLTRALARELARTGVTVNAVCPGYTDTELVGRAVETIVARTGRSAAAARNALAATNPMGRLVTPAEVAAAVVFLCRPDAAAVTGQALVVAGGEAMG